MSGRYEVHAHRYGRPGSFLPNGQFWETGLPSSVWVMEGAHARTADALASAELSVTHAVVVDGHRREGTVFDNGKAPLDHRDFAGKI